MPSTFRNASVIVALALLGSAHLACSEDSSGGATNTVPMPSSRPPVPPASEPEPPTEPNQVPVVPDPMPDPPIDPPEQPPIEPPQEMPTEPDAPHPWPPPGTDYLTQLTSKADFEQLASRGVTFIMRRRDDYELYPYPWDSYECVFAAGEHLSFLERMDPERALQLYYGDSKRPESSLVPGRISLVSDAGTDSMKIWIENTYGLNLAPNYMLDAAVGALIRERIARCIPFITQFTFAVVCPDGTFDCPLPH